MEHSMADKYIKRKTPQARLKQILEASREKTPEEIQQLEDDRIHTEDEIKALFYKYDEIYGYERYEARPVELVKYLETREHAIAFWKDPHIKMIYNISDYHNFLLSIYAEEINNKLYEAWLRKYFSNPFFNHIEFNYEMFLKLECLNVNFIMEIGELIETLNENQRYILLEREFSHLNDVLKHNQIFKAVNINDLLDKAGCLNGIEISKDLPEELTSGLNHLASATQEIENTERYLAEAEQGNQVLVNLARARDNIISARANLAQANFASMYGGNSKSMLHSLLNISRGIPPFDADETDIDEKNILIIQDTLEKSLQNARQARQEIETDFQKLVNEFCEKVCLYHPLLMMNNNFINIDSYYFWRDIYRQDWENVIKRNPDMFAILDALVTSRKIYLEEIRK